MTNQEPDDHTPSPDPQPLQLHSLEGLIQMPEEDQHAALPFVIDENKSGNLEMRRWLERFVYLDRDYRSLLGMLDEIQRLTIRLPTEVHEALAEVQGSDPAEGIYGVFQWQRRSLEEMRELYQELRHEITDHDPTAAALYERLDWSLPDECSRQRSVFVHPDEP